MIGFKGVSKIDESDRRCVDPRVVKEINRRLRKLLRQNSVNVGIDAIAVLSRRYRR